MHNDTSSARHVNLITEHFFRSFIGYASAYLCFFMRKGVFVYAK